VNGGLILGAIILWVVPIFVTVSMGRAKNREGWAYGVFLGWLGVIILALLPPLAFASDVHETKRCPDCDEAIRENANVCRFCGYRFSAVG
jgi:hypothetical protein